MNKFDLKNRVAIVTGGAQGFGLGIVKKFLESGAEVFIWDVDEEISPCSATTFHAGAACVSPSK